LSQLVAAFLKYFFLVVSLFGWAEGLGFELFWVFVFFIAVNMIGNFGFCEITVVLSDGFIDSQRLGKIGFDCC